jgi:Fur family peroxide stress response transcriptional regulator
MIIDKELIAVTNQPPMEQEDQVSFEGSHRLQELIDRLSTSGHRITPQRVLILKALLDGPSHPSAEAVYEQVKVVSSTTSLATVYKTLQTLKELGEVVELETHDGSHRYDALRPDDHAHAVCTSCGKIVDLNLEDHAAIDAVASSQSGFKIMRRRLDYFGYCSDCVWAAPPA